MNAPLTLTLLVPGVLTDDAHGPVTTDHLAFLTDLLDRRSNLHDVRFALVYLYR